MTNRNGRQTRPGGLAAIALPAAALLGLGLALALSACDTTAATRTSSTAAATATPTATAGTPSPTPSTPPTPASPAPRSPSPAPRATAAPPVSPSPAASPAASLPGVITQSDGNQVITLAKGATDKLELPTTMDWSTPAVTGNAVTVTPVTMPAGTGYDEWEVTAVAPGQATIRSGGSPICTPGMACPQFIIEFQVTISVP